MMAMLLIDDVDEGLGGAVWFVWFDDSQWWSDQYTKKKKGFLFFDLATE